MLDKVLILTTGWEEDYWEKEKEAPYSGRKYTDLSEWDSLRENCPIAGLGIYTKYRKNDFRIEQQSTFRSTSSAKWQTISKLKV